MATAADGPLATADSNSCTPASVAGVKESAGVPSNFYCSSKVDWQGKKSGNDMDYCGNKVGKKWNRDSRVEWEHVMPAWH
ncbi:deoxyribonuclease I, partial [Klebsiella pneumoniae]